MSKICQFFTKIAKYVVCPKMKKFVKTCFVNDIKFRALVKDKMIVT